MALNASAGALPRIAMMLSWNSMRNTLLLSIAYYLSGLVGLIMQSAQTGVSPFWPASGVAIAAFIIYGIHLWPAIYLGMLALVITVDLPLIVTLTAGTGSVMEAVIPLLILRRYGFNGAIQDMRQLLFFLLIAWTGPIFSAALGTGAMFIARVDLMIPAMNIFLTWWLGNSFGIMLVGAVLLRLHQCLQGASCDHFRDPFMLIIASLAIMPSVFVFQDMTSLSSALILNLMVPLVILSSIRIGFAGTLVPVSAAVGIMLFMASEFPATTMDQYPLGILYLDIVELWVITLTGLLAGVAHKEGVRHLQSKWMSSHDGLTSLRNRHYLEEQLDLMCQGLRVGDQTFSLLFLDLNRFKRVNDQAGHLVGDSALVHVAQILLANTRESDTVARWGGDEFIILLPECRVEKAVQVAENINRKLNDDPFQAGGHSYPLDFSIGLAESYRD